MFEKIILRRSDKGPALTIGELAEALLFYQNVHLVLDYPSLNYFVKTIGMPTLLSLISRPNVSAVYCEDTLGTRTQTHGSFKKHTFVSITVSGNQTVGQLNNRKKRLEFLLSRHGYGKRPSIRLAQRFRKHVPIRKYSGNKFIEGGIIKAAFNDLLEPDFVFESMRRVLSNRLGQTILPSDFTFKIHPHNPSFFIETNLNFDSISAKVKSRYPNVGDITEASLINQLLMARADTILAAHYGGEFYTSNIASEIICLRHKELLKRIGLDQKELNDFFEVVIPNYPTIREILNNGERTFDEFLLLLDKSQKFKKWAQSVHPDDKLVNAYLTDIAAEGWISKYPVKAIRYLIGATVGLVQPALGISLSAADSLLVDKMVCGWRPNHFIRNKLQPFLNGNK